MNIAVFLPNWVGDAVMATPAVRALRTQYPGSRFIGVLKSYVADVFEGSAWLDEQIFANNGSWSQGVIAVARRLRQRRIDLAVLFSNSFRSALTCWLGGCRERIGYARYGRSPLLTDALSPVRDERGRLLPSPVLDAYNLLAERAGCPAPGHRLELYTTTADERRADTVWAAANFHSHQEIIALNPGAAFGAAKHWPDTHFAELARALATRRGAGVLVLCGPAERAQAHRIVERAAHPAVHSLGDTAANLSLGLTKACVRRAALLVTTDSGPRHFAAAFDRPVVTLFGPTHIEWTETYFPRAVHMQKRVDCGPCQRRVCPLDHRCMRDLLPHEVFTAAEQLLDAKPALVG